VNIILLMTTDYNLMQATYLSESPAKLDAQE
jgi:hypothetical protein